LGIELDHHSRHLVHDPQVVLRIDADLRGEQESIQALADLARELAGAIELKEPRSPMRKGTGRGHRQRRMTGARVDEHVATRIGRNAADFAEIDIIRERQHVRCGIEGHGGRQVLGRQRHRHAARDGHEQCESFHRRSPDLHACPRRSLWRGGSACRGA
jgi:hypothetical protein